MKFGVKISGLELRDYGGGVRFRVQGLGLRLLRGFKGFKFEGSGTLRKDEFMVQGLGLRV